MNAKFALALILTLQVSMSFCEQQDLPQDLVNKYNEIKDRLSSRIYKLYSDALNLAESNEQARAVKGQLEGVSADSKAVAFRQVGEAIRLELEPLVAGARFKLLSFYNEHLRTYVRPALEAAIDTASGVLDKFAPTE